MTRCWVDNGSRYVVKFCVDVGNPLLLLTTTVLVLVLVILLLTVVLVVAPLFTKPLQ